MSGGPVAHHYLKCWPMYFEEILTGRKTFDVRATADRIFQAGDAVTFCEFSPQTKNYLGREHTVEVIGVYHDLPGVAPGHCVLSICQRSTPDA